MDEEKPMPPAGPEILKNEGELLEIKHNEKIHAFQVAELGWYEPEKIMEDYALIEKDETRPKITSIKMQFAEIDMDILKKGILKYSIDGTEVPKSIDAFKKIPAQIKDLVVGKIAPTMEKERDKLKNFVRS